MNEQTIKDYIFSKTEIEAPEVQNRFSLSYAEMKRMLDKMTAEGNIEYRSGISYKVLKKQGDKAEQRSIYRPRSKLEEQYIKALWECVRIGHASPAFVQRRCNVAYRVASQAVEWMEEKGFVGVFPDREVKLSVEDFYKKFGSPQENPALYDDDDRFRRLQTQRRSLLERFRRLADETKEDDADDDKDDDGIVTENPHDEDEDDDDEEDGVTVTDKDESEPFDFKALLVACLAGGIGENKEKGCYVLDLNDGNRFECKLVQFGSALRITDCGKTLEDTEKTPRRVQNVLKNYAPVVLENDEITISVQAPAELLGALLKLVTAVDAVKKLK